MYTNKQQLHRINGVSLSVWNAFLQKYTFFTDRLKINCAPVTLFCFSFCFCTQFIRFKKVHQKWSPHKQAQKYPFFLYPKVQIKTRSRSIKRDKSKRYIPKWMYNTAVPVFNWVIFISISKNKCISIFVRKRSHFHIPFPLLCIDFSLFQNCKNNKYNRYVHFRRNKLECGVHFNFYFFYSI